jgi:glycine cleavage system pyridoxal-binding protein P
MGARWKTRATSNNCTIQRSRGLQSAKQMLIIGHKFIAHFLERTAKATVTASDGWNEIPPMIVTHEGMEKLRTSVTVLEVLAFKFLTKELFFRKLQCR